MAMAERTGRAFTTMKFVLKFEKDCTIPAAWCEVCNTEITDAELPGCSLHN
jgi:hypothetical protein